MLPIPVGSLARPPLSCHLLCDLWWAPHLSLFGIVCSLWSGSSWSHSETAANLPHPEEFLNSLNYYISVVTVIKSLPHIFCLHPTEFGNFYFHFIPLKIFSNLTSDFLVCTPACVCVWCKELSRGHCTSQASAPLLSHFFNPFLLCFTCLSICVEARSQTGAGVSLNSQSSALASTRDWCFWHEPAPPALVIPSSTSLSPLPPDSCILTATVCHDLVIDTSHERAFFPRCASSCRICAEASIYFTCYKPARGSFLALLNFSLSFQENCKENLYLLIYILINSSAFIFLHRLSFLQSEDKNECRKFS